MDHPSLLGSNRLGLMVVLAFLLVGFALLWPVREERAQRKRVPGTAAMVLFSA